MAPGVAARWQLGRQHGLAARAGGTKTALFFLAFLPQFVRPERGSSLVQFLVLGLIFVALSITYTTVLALSVRPLLRYVKQLSWLGRWQGKIVGTIFVGLGVRVALQRQ